MHIIAHYAFCNLLMFVLFFFFFQAEDGIRDHCVTGVQTCALPIFFLQTSAAAALAAPFSKVAGAKSQPAFNAPLAETLRAGQSAPYVATNEGKKPLRLGLIIGIGRDPDAAMAKVRELGLPTSQVFADEFEMEIGRASCRERVKSAW